MLRKEAFLQYTSILTCVFFVRSMPDCTAACDYRCSESSHPNGCKRACGTCCIRCNCVPPGTSGNQQACGVCYARQKGPDGNPKCP
ncbi:hypothetical protein KP509_07G011000 [Ceratopteris richardii]|nr:hypothetical protein KP509_07G011000 [Ceratopteris richardii]